VSRLNRFLHGMRVLDLSQYIPGPMTSLFLADMGAEILKIEPPQGDEMTRLGPRDRDGAPVYYRALNAGKSVRRMNLKDPSSRSDFYALTAEYDVLIEGFRPGVTQRLGVDYDTLRSLNPGLIYCSISGFGAESSLKGQAAHDGNFMAGSGLLDRNGDSPMFFDPPLSDVSGALFAAVAILGAVQERHRTGLGCHIDLGLADVMAPLQLMQVAAFGASRRVPKTGDTYLNGGAAYYQIYRTRDSRHVMLGSLEPKFWSAFCVEAGRPDWINRHGESIPQRDLLAEVASFFASLTLAETLARFAQVDCCLSPVLDLAQALSAPHVLSRALVRAAGPGELQALLPVYVDGEPPNSRSKVSIVDGGSPAEDGEAQRPM
jgi:alpha-methylacyl-CoA racemase